MAHEKTIEIRWRDLNPAFTQRQDDPGDMAVVVFASPVGGITPASLPTEAQLDELGPQGLHDEVFSPVGYGISTFFDPFSAGTRRVGEGRFLSLTPGWLRLAGGERPGCIGDSGAPILLGNSNLVVGIGIRGAGPCENNAAGWILRVDTPSARAFLGQFVTLPS